MDELRLPTYKDSWEMARNSRVARVAREFQIRECGIVGKSYNKLYGAESRFNNIRFNDLPGVTMEIQSPKRKVFPVTTI